MKNECKKPLYRKVSKTTHNGFEHADYGYNERSRYARHTKRGIKKGMSTQQDSRGHGLYDYTPLFKFLLTQEGKDWSKVWDECMHRLNTTEPVGWMVINIYKNGLVNPNVKIEFTDTPSPDWKGRDTANCNIKSFNYGEGASFSTMYVDEEGKLQFVDKNYVCGPDYEVERRWGETFNGRLYETYKRPAEKMEKMKSYIKPAK